jgi:ABC-2 type transport system ATP-binding protein
MSDAIRTAGLTKYYGDRCVVQSLDLRIERGAVYGLLGRNGSGKSTFLKMLLGFVHPSYGESWLLDENTRELRPETRARIAYVAEGHPFPQWMTVGELTCFTRRFYTRWNDDLCDQILDHFALSKKAKIRRLSNGQRAQVSLAVAVAPDPELLILDDPTLALDTVVRRDFLESLVQIIQRMGRTILISSHVLADVERIADRIGILCDGVLRVDCPTEHFKMSLRKVILEFSAEPPAFPACDGLVSAWRVGQRLEVVIVGFGTRHEQLIESLDATAVDVLELNLEDAFIEFTRGPRRALPLLHLEQHDDERVGV